MNVNLIFITLVALLMLYGCGGKDPQSIQTSRSSDGPIILGDSPPRVPVTESRAGTSYVEYVPYIDNAGRPGHLAVRVFEPTQLEAGATYPLVLEGHGYGGSKLTTPDTLAQQLIDSGFYVISIDQLGFGESSGESRVISPDHEGQALVALLDWAEDLPGLRRRDNGEMYVGSYGSSYGGVFQLALHGTDPKHRLRVMAPDIAPYDLTYSLTPNGVLKSGWGSVLVGAGEPGANPLLASINYQTPDHLLDALQNGQIVGQAPLIYESLVMAILTGKFSEAGYNFFRYHSFAYFCEGIPAGPQDFVVGIPDPLMVAAELPPPADVFITQGNRDTVFNLNDALNNYNCLSGIGGDVRLHSHESGHILPVSLSTAGVEEPLDPFYSLVTPDLFQDGGGPMACGSQDVAQLRFAWFEEKLRGQAGAVDAAFNSGKDICMSLGNGDAVALSEMPRGGEVFELDLNTPSLSGVLSVGGAVLGNAAREAMLATVPVYTTPDTGAVLAGMPLMDLTISGLSSFELDECPIPLISTSCDPMLFFAIGHRTAGQERWDLVDDQVTPIRGFGQHSLDMNGIGERLNPGDELAILIYGFHAQFPVTWSRDLSVPAVNINGTISLPILMHDELAGQDVSSPPS